MTEAFRHFESSVRPGKLHVPSGTASFPSGTASFPGGTASFPGGTSAFQRGRDGRQPLRQSARVRPVDGEKRARHCGGALAHAADLARHPHSYVDHTPLAQPGVPEVREYRLLAMQNDAVSGQPSSILTVTVS